MQLQHEELAPGMTLLQHRGPDRGHLLFIPQPQPFHQHLVIREADRDLQHVVEPEGQRGVGLSRQRLAEVAQHLHTLPLRRVQCCFVEHWPEDTLAAVVPEASRFQSCHQAAIPTQIRCPEAGEGDAVRSEERRCLLDLGGLIGFGQQAQVGVPVAVNGQFHRRGTSQEPTKDRRMAVQRYGGHGERGASIVAGQQVGEAHQGASHLVHGESRAMDDSPGPAHQAGPAL